MYKTFVVLFLFLLAYCTMYICVALHVTTIAEFNNNNNNGLNLYSAFLSLLSVKLNSLLHHSSTGRQQRSIVI